MYFACCWYIYIISHVWAILYCFLVGATKRKYMKSNAPQETTFLGDVLLPTAQEDQAALQEILQGQTSPR